MHKTTPGQYQYLVWIILLLLIPALFINLGMAPLIGDEAIRGLVSFEMQHSGNLVTPTINGEHYYNKPPLYNWIVLGFFNLFKQNSAYILRLPQVISLLIFGLVIYLTTRKELGKRVAFLASLLFISCGRILFYDSMRGLIDLSFSVVIFLNFYLIYYFITRKKYFSFFLISYFLCSIAFLMKGLPAVIFQVLTLITALAYFRSLKILFHRFHLAGLLVFIILVGAYYYILWEDSCDPEFFRRLVSESTKRTFLENGFWSTVKHLFFYPFDQVYHLLPWSVLFIFLLRKSFYSQLRENKYLGYLALVFLVNIPVYWTSVGSHPRYVFMLYPILLILLVNSYADLKQNEKFFRVFWSVFFILSGLAAVALTLFFRSQGVSGSGRAVILFCVLLVTGLSVYYLMWKNKEIRLELLVVVLLIGRIFFNLVVLPDRLANTPDHEEITAAEEICEITRDSELMLHPVSPVSVKFIYYISTGRNEILRKEYGDFKKGTYYIFDAKDPLLEGETELMEFESSLEGCRLRLSIFMEDQ